MFPNLRKLAVETLESRDTPSGALPNVPAFPGAEGFGAASVGGRGGDIIEVTNLDDHGPGSLRSAVEARGPRTVIFRVGGTIELIDELEIKNPYITIAGQTAPGDGIQIKGDDLEVETNDVIIRYLRIRPGSHPKVDGIALFGAHDVIIDHCSMTWATDENASVTADSRNVTLQWNIIAEGLHQSTHPNGPHSKGSLLAESTNISVHHNLYAHNDARNPRIGSDTITAGEQTIDVVNNVIYDWGNFPLEVKGYVNANIVGNLFRPGPNSDGLTQFGRKELALHDFPGRKLYLEGNVGPHCPTGGAEQWRLVGTLLGEPVDMSQRARERFATPAITTSTTDEALRQVLAEAGAIYPHRDQVDARIIADVEAGTGRIINATSEVGGWPDLKNGTPPVDSDRDGMPDAWEKAHGLDPADRSDGSNDDNGDGYTNLEAYLNSLPQAPQAAQASTGPAR